MRIDVLTFLLGFIAIMYTFVGLATFLDIPSEMDWKTEYAKATTGVGVGCGLMLSLRLYNLFKKSRKVKEE